MRARTQIAIPEPKGSEFENFDRMAGILLQVKPAVKSKSHLKRKQSKPKA